MSHPEFRTGMAPFFKVKGYSRVYTKFNNNAWNAFAGGNQWHTSCTIYGKGKGERI
jgi:hypothetical protein